MRITITEKERYLIWSLLDDLSKEVRSGSIRTPVKHGLSFGADAIDATCRKFDYISPASKLKVTKGEAA